MAESEVVAAGAPPERQVFGVVFGARCAQAAGTVAVPRCRWAVRAGTEAG